MNNKLLTVYHLIKTRYFIKLNSREKIEKYQKKKIAKHLRFVRKHSELYRKCSNWPDSFPIMNKKLMMNNFNKLNTVGIDKDEALNCAINGEKTRDFSQKYHGITVGLSSGTSGDRGMFIVSDHDQALWSGVILAKLLPKGDMFGHKVAFFLRANSNLYEDINSKFITFKYFDILNSLESYIDELNNYEPTVVVAPPSVLIRLAEFKNLDVLKITPRRVISVAEVLEKRDSDIIKRAFSQEIIHQVYQCTEGFLGCTCEYGNMHINEDFVHIEKEYIDGDRFIPIITDFSRQAQPIIRYRLNDVLIENTEQCRCGSKMLRLEAIEGREDDIFIFPSSDGKSKINVYSDFIRRCILFSGYSGEYRVLQHDYNHITVELSEIPENTEFITKEFRTLAEKLMFEMPEISYETYIMINGKKLKRVERKF